MHARTRALAAILGTLTLLLVALPRAAPVQAATFTVTTTTDAAHSDPVDGNCTSTLPGNPCTLRAAIQATNFLGGGPHTINLSVPGTYTLTLGLLSLDSGNVTIANTSGARIYLDGNGASSVLYVAGGVQASITDVKIQNGSSMLTNAGTLTMTYVAISGFGGG